MTTVVLQFPEEPRYRIDRPQPGIIVVEMLADRLTPPVPPKVVQDPLVQAVAIEPQRVRVQLAAGAQAESYILQSPFRLVFDVHQTSAVEAPTTPLRPTQGAPGVRTIVIDPGHGGSESGAVGPSGVPEKELTLQLARELAGQARAAAGGADHPHPRRGRPSAARHAHGHRQPEPGGPVRLDPPELFARRRRLRHGDLLPEPAGDGPAGRERRCRRERRDHRRGTAPLRGRPTPPRSRTCSSSSGTWRRPITWPRASASPT